jgi:transposase
MGLGPLVLGLGIANPIQDREVGWLLALENTAPIGAGLTEQVGKVRKRHILVDTLGLLSNVVVHPADIQDRDGAFHLLRRARRLFPFIERIFVGYAGRKMAMTVWRTGAWSLQIVKRSDAAGFFAGWLSQEEVSARVIDRAALPSIGLSCRPIASHEAASARAASDAPSHSMTSSAMLAGGGELKVCPQCHALLWHVEWSVEERRQRHLQLR